MIRTLFSIISQCTDKKYYSLSVFFICRFLNIEAVIVNWTSGYSPVYETKIFQMNPPNSLIFLNEYPAESSTITNESVIFLTVKVPDFCHRLAFNSEGIILYKTNASEEVHQINLPNLNMSCKDLNDASLKIRTEDILHKDAKSILTYLVGNEDFDLVAKMKDNQNLVRDLYVQCGYEEISLSSGKILFLVNNSDDPNGSFIEITQGDACDIFKLRIMCSNEDVLFKILHIIYEKIDGICILPTSHEAYLHHLSNSQDDRVMNQEKFAQSIRKQLDHFQDFCKSAVRECGCENYLKFRSKLNELQLETDVLYSKCYNNL